MTEIGKNGQNGKNGKIEEIAVSANIDKCWHNRQKMTEKGKEDLYVLEWIILEKTVPDVNHDNTAILWSEGDE